MMAGHDVLSARYPQGLLFPEAVMREVRGRFLQVEHDHAGRPRMYFDNAGGSFRLKAAVERFAESTPCPTTPSASTPWRASCRPSRTRAPTTCA